MQGVIGSSPLILIQTLRYENTGAFFMIAQKENACYQGLTNPKKYAIIHIVVRV